MLLNRSSSVLPVRDHDQVQLVSVVRWRLAEVCLSCMTRYSGRMTMLSFRVDEPEASEAQSWADRLGMDRSELLRDALHRHLLRLASERDADRWQRHPLTADEQSLAAIEDWGPAEDWTDWADAAR